MPTIQCCQCDNPQAFGSRHNRSIDRAERQVLVAPRELGDSQPVTCLDRLSMKVSLCKISEESHFRHCPQS